MLYTYQANLQSAGVFSTIEVDRYWEVFAEVAPQARKGTGARYSALAGPLERFNDDLDDDAQEQLRGDLDGYVRAYSFPPRSSAGPTPGWRSSTPLPNRWWPTSPTGRATPASTWVRRPSSPTCASSCGTSSMPAWRRPTRSMTRSTPSPAAAAAAATRRRSGCQPSSRA